MSFFAPTYRNFLLCLAIYFSFFIMFQFHRFVCSLRKSYLIYVPIEMMFKKQLRASDWLKTSVTRVQRCNTSANYKQHVHAFKILSVLLFCNVFSCTSLTSNNMISLAMFGVISTCKFFKDYICTCPIVQLSLVQFCCLWQIHWCSFTLNCT